MNFNRALLDTEVESWKLSLEHILMYFQEKAPENCYCSIIAEKRNNLKFDINLKKENLTVNNVRGVNLRIFDGSSLYESATDNLNEVHLKVLADNLLSQINTKDKKKNLKPYYPLSWGDRLKLDLESEIKIQIPNRVSKENWVHFGIRQKTPLMINPDELMNFCKIQMKRFSNFKDKLPSEHLSRSPDFIGMRMSIEKLDFLFLDSEVKMSQSLTRNSIMPILLKGEERGTIIQGGLGGLETLVLTEKHLKQAYDNLEKALKAKPLTPGRYKLLMSPSITGVFAHEAFGHSQEGDTWARGRSKAKELFEEKVCVGNQFATILNDPAVYQNGPDDFAAWGSYFFDEEGWFAQKQYLVKEGYLKEPMTNLTSAIRLNVPRTANGKREDWSHGTYTRQTNTYFEQGESTFDDLIGKVDYGFLATVPYGGMEDPKGMGIQVGMAFLEEIKDGQFTGNIFKGPNGGGVQMTGYVPDYLNSILGASKIDSFNRDKDISEKPWNEVGGCGKYHKELVQAGCGGTYLLVENVLLS